MSSRGVSIDLRGYDTPTFYAIWVDRAWIDARVVTDVRVEVVMAGRQSPVLVRQQLGMLLREHREANSLTAQQVAKTLEVTPAVITRLERGQRRPGVIYVKALCQLYGLGKTETDQLLSLARAGHEDGWWERLDLRSGASEFIGFESGAASIHAFELGFVPGLLQVPSYIDAVLSTRRPRFEEDEQAKARAARIARQAILTGPDPVAFHAIIDEGVLRRTVATPSVMREQLHHLVEQSQLPNLKLQVLPSSSGSTIGAGGAFSVLSFSEGVSSDVAHVETPLGSIWQKGEGAARCKAIFTEIAELSATEQESLDLLNAILHSHWKA